MQNKVEGSYWPVLETKNIKTPISDLKEQGEKLKKITNGLLTYSISKKALAGEKTAITFDIVAPQIDNLKYNLFRLSYPSLEIFPMFINYLSLSKEGMKQNVSNVIKSWDEFDQTLQKILSSEKTKNILEKLLAHSKAASEV